jgi:HD-like signal output (HDOD) protein
LTPVSPEARKPAPVGPEPAPRGLIGELLIEAGLITEKQLQDALAVQTQRGGKTFDILIALGHLNKERLHTFLSKQPGVASLDLGNYQIHHDLLSLIPKEFAIKHLLLPIDKMGKLLTVGMACPLDTTTIKEVEILTGLRVKAMLCRLDDIHTAVKKYYATEAAAATVESLQWAKTAPRKDDIAVQLAGLDFLPVLPETVEKVKGITSVSPSFLREAAGVVGRDPALAAKLLSVANSSAYGLPQQVNNIWMALALLGCKGTQELICSSKVVRDGDAKARFDYEGFRAQCVFCAVAAQALAKACLPDQMAVSYTAGLLHEIGRLAFVEVQPKEYAAINPILSGIARLDAESQALNVSHAEAGQIVARTWRLPPELAEAIAFHHNSEKAAQAKELVGVVALAAAMAEAHTQGGMPAPEFFEAHKNLFKTMGLDKRAVARIMQESAAAIKG